MPRNEVRSEVAGTVWKIERQVGDAVSAGDVVMVLESMKMEIPVGTATDGAVAELLVEANASVEEGTALFVIES